MTGYKRGFEDFLCDKTDAIYNAAYELICAIAAVTPDQDDSQNPEWNMEYIGEVVDDAESILCSFGIRHCYPFYTDNETPCYCGTDCQTEDCIFKMTRTNPDRAISRTKETITIKQIERGIQNGVIRFISDPNMGYGTVCEIGEYWFYFGGESAEEEEPEDYVKNVPLDDLCREIFETLNDFQQDETHAEEYEYYATILSK